MSFDEKGNNEISIGIGKACMKEYVSEVVIGVTFVQSLSLKQHDTLLCKQAVGKLDAVVRISCTLEN